MRNLTHIAAAAATIAVVAGFGLVAAEPASAAASNCPSGASCIWKDANYTTTTDNGHGGGDWVGFQQYLKSFVGYYYSWAGSGYYNTANDSASSIYNNGNSCTAAYYRDAGFGTLALKTTKKTGWSNLAVSGGWNDQLSAGQFICG